MPHIITPSATHYEIRNLAAADIPLIVEAFARFSWHKPASTFQDYLSEQQNQQCYIWVAFAHNKLAGYVTLKLNSDYSPFREQNIPEISDLNILPPFRRQGIGSLLLDMAEAKAAEHGRYVGIGVGLYADYGTAQRLYVKRNYIPDGRGLTYHYQQVQPGSTVPLDDELILWFTKKLF